LKSPCFSVQPLSKGLNIKKIILFAILPFFIACNASPNYDVDLTSIINEKNKNLKSIYLQVKNNRMAKSMLKAKDKDVNIAMDILKKLNISIKTDKSIAIQTIFNYIRFKTNHYDDKENDKGVKTPSRFINDGCGDCEDKATFALLLFQKLNIDTYIVDIDKNNQDYHIALGVILDKNLILVDFISKNNNSINSLEIIKFNQRTFKEYSSEEYQKSIVIPSEIKY